MTTDVSIVLVTYNRASFLRKTLDSLMVQTYPHFELLICDDSSTDETERVCREYAEKDRRIIYVKNPGNLGMPGNLNSGLQKCKCEFVADLHDGDIYAPTLIEKWRDALIKHPQAGFVFNRYRHLASDGTCAWDTPAFPEVLSGSEFLDLCFADNRGCPVWGTVMGRRSVYEHLGWFDGRYRFWADIDMWFRIAESYPVAHVPELLIDLPARETMPRLFAKGVGGTLASNATVFKVYWRARCRHLHHRPMTLAVHLAHQTIGYWSLRVFRRIAHLLQAA